MDTPVQQVTWAARYGIAQRHWDIIRRYAADRHVYVLIRAGSSPRNARSGGRVVDATDPHAGAGKGAPGQDRVVVFRPDGRVAMVTAPARAWARMQVGGLMAALRPGRGAESTSRDMP
jgi:hypothetical protein